ncbi:hypothetical protein D9619_003955 [Psilocybe cf. subviscida]|uniref:Uncharacterized protein n=1 Tax=Psilocybe cf. subviscida TaxID=2480587 RepID=A0A8H5BQC9_9AGAR|nr:hypothetical protein D9619_003955 [Psilocybe cf. subviscida]
MSGREWEPNLRTFVLSTATLGITKAVLVSREETISSTTVEWVAGVVLALSFQLISPLEFREHYNPVAWFIFSQDCLQPLWKVLPRPYVDDERPVGPRDQADDSADHQKYHLQKEHAAALVTPYRLLVSTVTVGFGVVKMSCAYMGLDATMNTVEWAFSVPIVLLLYYVGLYENNTMNLGRTFFDLDCFNGVIFVVVQAFYALLISGSSLFVLFWIKYWYNAVIEIIASPITMLGTPFANDPIPQWVHYLHDQSFVVLAGSVMTIFALCGLVPLLSAMLYLSEPILKATRWISVRARRLAEASTLVRTIVSRLGDAGSVVQPYAFPILINLAFVFFYAVAVFLCFDFGIFALGLGVRLFPSLYLQTDVFVLKILNAVMAFCFGAASYAPFRGGWVIFKEMLRRVPVLRQNASGGLFDHRT